MRAVYHPLPGLFVKRYPIVFRLEVRVRIHFWEVVFRLIII
jgi:hypothetical protein